MVYFKSFDSDSHDSLESMVDAYIQTNSPIVLVSMSFSSAYEAHNERIIYSVGFVFEK